MGSAAAAAQRQPAAMSNIVNECKKFIKMEDIFHWIRKGDAIQVRMWLDDTEHDMNQGDDHQFSPLHWAAKGGHTKIVEMLMSRGARVHTTNMGDDTPLHLATAHGHRDVVQMLLRQKADV